MPKLLPIALILALACAACESATESGAGAGAGDDLADSHWRLVRLDGEPPDLAGGPGEAPRIHFLPGGEASGFGGCNRFGARYERQGDRLSVDSIASTKMACPGIGDLEQRFFSALQATAAYRVENGDLVLLGDGGTALARLEREQSGAGK